MWAPCSFLSLQALLSRPRGGLLHSSSQGDAFWPDPGVRCLLFSHVDVYVAICPLRSYQRVLVYFYSSLL